ncbi:uncharacterized protein LOC108674533 [Hyalella azteca]|uniref:Uncharacterized protein LOC108674533 n=1 Tax=Hyalella azteca TaxID=294128 RepID=A0A8B7NW50_HYAAZ|nr:uncharacterized protein LOC108674533 [Hyalella azteca]
MDEKQNDGLEVFEGGRLGAPTITGAGRALQEDEVAELRCAPGPQPDGEPLPRLAWLLDGQEVGASVVERYGAFVDAEVDIHLSVPASQVVAEGGSLQVECRVSLGPLRNSAVVVLRMRPRETFISSATPATAIPIANLLMFLSMACVIMSGQPCSPWSSLI